MPAFSARSLGRLEAHITGIIDGMLDKIERGGNDFDGMEDYGAQLVVGALLTAMVNLDERQQEIFLAFHEVLPLTTYTRPGEPFAPECVHAFERAAELVHEMRDPDVAVLERLAAGEALGTLFPAAVDQVESRKRWMLSGLSSRGRIFVDAGAARALREQHKSLLPAGVVGVAGPFGRGDAVQVCEPDGALIAYGISNYADTELDRLRGVRSDRIEETLGYTYGAEAIHRNNLVGS